MGLKADRETKQPRTESMISRLSNLLFYGDNFTAMNPVTFMAIAKEFTLVSAEIGCIRSLDEMPSAVVLPTIIHGGEPSKVSDHPPTLTNVSIPSRLLPRHRCRYL